MLDPHIRLAALLFGMLSVAVPAVAQSIETPESEAVYRAVLADTRCSGTVGIRGSIPMLRRETVNVAATPWALEEARLRERIPGLSSSLAARFIQAQEVTTISTETARALGATTIAQSDVDALASKNGADFWDALFRTYPSAAALVDLSGVTFNESLTEALVYCAYGVSGIGGEGSIVFLQRAGIVWAPAHWLRVWIS
jgi:hypothetical protein